MNEQLKNDAELAWSPIVANNSMNRKRKAVGVNSYAKDIKLDPIKYLSERLAQQQDTFRWLDLCCGEGNALIQTAKHFNDSPLSTRLDLQGIDLVNYFSEVDPDLTKLLSLRALNLSNWKPEDAYDLVTVVHGLHYIGDKLGLIIKVAEQLKPDGLLIGNLDLNNIRIVGQVDAKKLIKQYFLSNGIHYNSRTKILELRGGRTIMPKFEYLGADDKAGPNYTGQEVVNSIYKVVEEKNNGSLTN